MSKPRLYLDFGRGYSKDKADTFGKIVKRLEQVHNDVDKYLVIQEINKCDEILLFGYGNVEQIEEFKKKVLK